MATKLNRRVVRETVTPSGAGAGPLMIALVPATGEGTRDRVELWPKGSRKRVSLAVEGVWVYACRLQSDHDRAEKRRAAGRKPQADRGLFKVFGA